MRPEIYKNVKELSYGELLELISNIKEKIDNNKELAEYTSEYYELLVDELGNRQLLRNE